MTSVLVMKGYEARSTCKSQAGSMIDRAFAEEPLKP